MHDTSRKRSGAFADSTSEVTFSATTAPFAVTKTDIALAIAASTGLFVALGVKNHEYN